MPLNLTLLDEILTQIDLHPETHDQTTYKARCGTAFCIGGWAIEMDPDTGWLSRIMVRVRGERKATSAYDRARVLLGLTDEQAVALFRAENTREDIEEVADLIRLGVL